VSEKGAHQEIHWGDEQKVDVAVNQYREGQGYMEASYMERVE